ncbi:ribosomal RNA-processing protein 7 A [Biomphalaria pfeifferi]|uniref:Ribosomal RNA-processing protein 7 A n=1 Tax=Biomphalaria pfeifferi TaxID=112525 RepID=A0AAD8F121_BIOPF|nr:ribosomal RNA-processing protein 7 A [Biomphalaria pfeifferi]
MIGRSNSSSLVVKDYTVIQVKTSERSHASHCLFVKEHASAHNRVEWPKGRTLIVYNVPPYCKEENIRLLLKDCGEIMRVFLQPKSSIAPMKTASLSKAPKTVQVAYVVFKKPTGVRNACSFSFDTVHFICDQETPLRTGLRGYIEDYRNIPDVTAMEKESEKFMDDYFKTKDEEDKKEKEKAGQPDEEGFIKVMRHGKNKGGKRTEDNQKKGHEHIRKRNKKNELKDFYSFQFRETKRKHILELQAKFEEDKKRVKEMRQARKFRPY